MKLFIMTAATVAFSAERFDMEVRNDFFAGFSEEQALDRV